MADNAPKQPKKRYFKTTKSPAIKVFEMEYARTNNATKAVQKAFPGQLTYGSAAIKGNRLLKNDNVARGIEEQRKAIERHADKAVESLAELSTSAKSEMVRHSSSSYLVDQAHGKATQRIEQRTQSVTLVVDMTGGKYGDPPKKDDNKAKE